MNIENLELRLETKSDYATVENVTREAFWDVYRPGCSEHLVLHHLRDKASYIPELDYVALFNGEIVAHIVYSRMFDMKNHTMCEDMIGFGPVSVLPKVQKLGIGKKLIKYTLQKAKELGYKGVMITGSSDYYPRLGFEKASDKKIYLPGMEGQDAPFFMVQDLEEGYLAKHPGIYDFDPCFNVDDKELEEFEKHFPSKKMREPRDTDLNC